MLQVASNPTIVDVTLKVGAVNEQVVVEAAATMVETQNTGVGQVIDQQRVVDLPLNGRQVTDLILLTGGANASTLTGPSVLSVLNGRLHWRRRRGHGVVFPGWRDA